MCCGGKYSTVKPGWISATLIIFFITNTHCATNSGARQTDEHVSEPPSSVGHSIQSVGDPSEVTKYHFYRIIKFLSY
jgi:hypothetical protein